jgi:hypothetical protein
LFLGATGVVFVAGLQSMQFQLFEKKWGWLLDTLWAVAAANDLIIAATLVFWLARKREDSELMFVASVVRSICVLTLDLLAGPLSSTRSLRGPLVRFVRSFDSLLMVSFYYYQKLAS